MKPPADLADKLNRIEWRKPAAITPEAEQLIQEHIRKMGTVINSLGETARLSPSQAYAAAQSAGHDAPGYDALLDTLFKEVTFRNAGVREALILSIAGAYTWDEDERLRHLENPWLPLLSLYEMGYTSSFEEGGDGQTIDLLIGYQGEVKSYRIV
jgi:hypothetical protein